MPPKEGIRALFKFAKIPDGYVVVDTTSNTDPRYRNLSPFVLSAPPAKRFENLWQFSKVYPQQVYASGEPTKEWGKWRQQGWDDNRAHRYPMGKSAKPLYSYWEGQHLDYIQARKQIYAPEYAKNVSKTDSYATLCKLYGECLLYGEGLILLDYDAYDHQALGMSLVDVINNSHRKMGHAFVLMMMLTDKLEECIGS